MLTITAPYSLYCFHIYTEYIKLGDHLGAWNPHWMLCQMPSGGDGGGGGGGISSSSSRRRRRRRRSSSSSSHPS